MKLHRAVAAVGLVAVLVGTAAATTFFEETFDDDSWEERWVHSKAKKDMAKFKRFAGQWSPDEDETSGIATSKDMKFHAVSAKLPEAFSNRDKDLVIQFTAKYETNSYSICSGGYLKLMPSSLDQSKFDGDSEYAIMFGPDRCGYDVSRIHAIFNHNGENLLKKDEAKLDYSDKNEFTHLYTLIVHPDNTYDIQFDQKSKATGSLYDGWDFPQKEIPDPKDKKPADWVDEAKIPDPEDKKPEDWDDVPAMIPDPDAEQPEDWDEEDDGQWEAPMIDNPEYKGEWKAKMIDNPEYKGEWKAKRIPNPDYVDDVYAYDDLAYVGFELWVVNNGTIFDNIIITDSVKEAKAHAKKHWKPIADAEKAAKEAFDKANKPAEEDKDDADDEDEDDEHDEL